MGLSIVAYSIILIAAVITVGLTFSRIKFGSVSLGVTWILFVGIVAGHFGLTLDHVTSHFVKEFGLILFVYSIGMEVGPNFFSSFKSGGVTLNLLAVGLVLLGSATAYVIHLVTGESLSAMTGVLYGAVTNTPGLGAAQQAFSDIHNGASNAIYAQGYAVAYPLGVVGIILSIIVIRYIFKINFEKEQTLFDNNVQTGKTPEPSTIKSKKMPIGELTLEQLSLIFLGIALGVLLGSAPIPIPGMPVPVKLGLAGGPLVVSILLSYFGSRKKIAAFSTTVSANMQMRQMGICLFMAAVGLDAGDGFVSTIVSGGYVWILYGFIITFLPCITIGIIARVFFHRSYFTIAGLISGSMTDPPALAYSNSICGNDQASVAYSTVYPLTMFMRVIVAQILVLMAM